MKKKMGRPPKYQEWLEPDKLILIEGWARDGLIDEQIAHNMGISVQTLWVYKNSHPEIREVIKKGKEVVDYYVENALLQKALDGDVTAQIFWLKNRKPSKWRDKQDIEVKSNVDLTKVSDDNLKKIERILDAETKASKSN